MPISRVHAKLIATSAVTDLLSGTNKIQPIRIPQTLGARPYVLLQQITGGRVNSSASVPTTKYCTIQVDCYADTYNEVKALALVVDAALSGWTDATGDPQVSSCHLQEEMDLPEQPDPDKDVIIHRISFDFLLYYNAE